MLGTRPAYANSSQRRSQFMSSRSFRAFAAAGLLATATASHAGFLTNTVGLTRETPSLGSVLIDAGTAVVGTGVEFSNVGLRSEEAFDLTDNSIRYTRARSIDFVTVEFNGWVIRDALNSIDEIIGISDVVFSNMGTFDPSRITFDINHININLSGLSTSDNASLSFNVQFRDAIAVPTPGTLVLVAAALLALGVGRKGLSTRTE